MGMFTLHENTELAVLGICPDSPTFCVCLADLWKRRPIDASMNVLKRRFLPGFRFNVARRRP